MPDVNGEQYYTGIVNNLTNVTPCGFPCDDSFIDTISDGSRIGPTTFSCDAILPGWKWTQRANLQASETDADFPGVNLEGSLSVDLTHSTNVVNMFFI